MREYWGSHGEDPAERALAGARIRGLDGRASLTVETWLRAEAEHRVVHEYDTLDRDLERLGMKLARLPSEAGVVWRLGLPRGERVEAWEPGTSGLAPPADILRLIEAVTSGKDLVPTLPVGSDPGLRRLRTILQGEREALLAHDPGARVGDDHENLRRLRLALLRARAVVRSSRRQLDPVWRRSALDELALVLDATDEAAQLDALLDDIQPALDQPDELDVAGATELADILSQDRRAAQQRALDALEDERYHVLLARLQLPPRLKETADGVPLERLVRRDVRRVARAVERLGKAPGEPALARLRPVLDRARHVSELVGPGGKLARRFVADVAAVRDLLAAQEQTVAGERLLRHATVVDRPTAAAFAAGRLAERHSVRRARLVEQLPSAWRRLRSSGAKLAA
jgi:CHAD domain-containing protein